MAMQKIVLASNNPGKLRDIVVVRLENKSATLSPSIKVYDANRSQIASKYVGTRGASVELPRESM